MGLRKSIVTRLRSAKASRCTELVQERATARDLSAIKNVKDDSAFRKGEESQDSDDCSSCGCRKEGQQQY